SITSIQRARNDESLEARGNRAQSENLVDLFAADFAEDVLGDVDGNIGGNGQGDGVAGPAVDLDELPIDADAELGEIGVIAQLADENVLQIAAHAVDDAGDKIMSQGSGRRHFFCG